MFNPRHWSAIESLRALAGQWPRVGALHEITGGV